MFPKRCSSSRLDQIKLRVNQLIEYVNCTKWHSCVHFLLPSRAEAVLFNKTELSEHRRRWCQTCFFKFLLLILGGGKMILRGRGSCWCVFVFLQFRMLKKEIIAERLQMEAVYCGIPEERTTAQSFTVYC